MEHTQQKGLRRGMEWEAHKTVRLTEKRKKITVGREREGRENIKCQRGWERKKWKIK